MSAQPYRVTAAARVLQSSAELSALLSAPLPRRRRRRATAGLGAGGMGSGDGGAEGGEAGAGACLRGTDGE